MTTPNSNKIATAADFKSKRPRGIEYPLPSGFVCLVKRPGITELIAEGLFPDSLMSMVGGFIDTGQGKKKPGDRQQSKSAQDKKAEKAMTEAMEALTQDPEKLRDMLLTVDKAVVYCVLQPKVLDNRYPADHDAEALRGQIIPEDDRIEDALYVDEVDDEDKMSIFNFAVGGDGDEMNALAMFPHAK